jgi:hypothetical protein
LTSPGQTRSFAIYLLGPCPDNKFYVGQTQRYEHRLRTHQLAKDSGRELYKAVARFGWDAFPKQIIAEADSPEEADRLERLHITKYNALMPGGYNMTLGGRGARFEPGSKTGFNQRLVSDAEVQALAQSLAAGDPLIEDSVFQPCLCCGAFGGSDLCRAFCGVSEEFIIFILRHVGLGLDISELPLIDDAKLLQKWRSCRDAAYFLAREIRGIRGRKIAEYGPYAADKYAQVFWPYLKASLQRRCLIRQGHPTHHQWRFKPLLGGRLLEPKRIETEQFIRLNRRDMDSGERNIAVFEQILRRQPGRTGPLYDAVLEVLAEHGGSPAEIQEAKRRVSQPIG